MQVLIQKIHLKTLLGRAIPVSFVFVARFTFVKMEDAEMLRVFLEMVGWLSSARFLLNR